MFSCEEYAPEELENAKTAEVQARLKFVVENGVRKPARSTYSDIALTIAYAIALHDSSQKEDDIVNRNYFKGIRNCLMSKRDQLALRMAKKLLNVDLKTSGYGGEAQGLGGYEAPLMQTRELAVDYDSDEAEAPDTSTLVELVNEVKNTTQRRGVSVTRKRKIIDHLSDEDMEIFPSQDVEELDTSAEKPTRKSRKKTIPAPSAETTGATDSAAKRKRSAAVKKPTAPRKKRASKSAELIEDSESEDKTLSSVADD
ncbi:hypothetical protein EON65_12960 [archaeon]|nr:MAG: hypothetical protein EON65_12960 [archaeon]